MKSYSITVIISHMVAFFVLLDASLFLKLPFLVQIQRVDLRLKTSDIDAILILQTLCPIVGLVQIGLSLFVKFKLFLSVRSFCPLQNKQFRTKIP